MPRARVELTVRTGCFTGRMWHRRLAVSRRWGPRPTPLEPAPRLAEALGLSSPLYVKRDDLTGPGLGGNKVRKLEHLLHDAAARGADTIVTAGAAQSNHCRLTAILGAAAGLDVHLVLTVGSSGEAPPCEGNLLLDHLAGATIHPVASDNWTDAGEALGGVVARMERVGRHVHPIPLGGSDPIGARGYVEAWMELHEQVETEGLTPSALVHASSSGGTQAGLLAGRALSGGEGPVVVGIDVAKTEGALGEDVLRLANDTLAALGEDVRIAESDVIVVPTESAYGEMTEEVVQTVRTALRVEGLITDPVYSGKALARLNGSEGIGGTGTGPVIFIHTGGQPALFTSATSRRLLRGAEDGTAGD